MVRTIAWGIISILCLSLFTSCEDIDGSNSLVGEWGGSGGQSMIFYPDGRVATRDLNGVTPDCRYVYDAIAGTLTITRPDGTVLEGNAITKVRLEFRGKRGKPIVFNRRGT